MSERSWGGRNKVGLTASVAASILLVAACIGWGLSESAEYERQARDHAAEYSEYTYDKVRDACIRLPTVDKADCLEKAYNERRANERNEQDLVAQKKSALWAYIMAAAAVIGMALSAVGVFLVWTTFRETKAANRIAMKTNARATRQAAASATDTAAALATAARNADAAEAAIKEAQRIGEAQIRCYLAPVSADLFINDDGVATITIRIENTGQTPCFKAHWGGQLKYYLIDTQLLRNIPFDVIAGVFEHDVASHREHDLNGKKAAERLNEAENSLNERFYVALSVNVEGADIFDKPVVMRAYFTWLFERGKDRMGVFTVKPTSEVRLIEIDTYPQQHPHDRANHASSPRAGLVPLLPNAG